MSNTIPIFLFPANGNALEAIDCLRDDYELLGFVDDNIEKQKSTLGSYKVYNRSVLEEYPRAKVLAVPGSPTTFKNRKKIIDSLELKLEKFETIIHPKANISSLAKIGRNVLIMAGVTITSNAEIGDNVCILPNTVIHHDVKLGDYSLVGSNVSIAGGVTINANCYIGSGTRIINDITIGENTLIGIGSNVLKSVGSNQKIVGNPARCI